MKTIGILGGMGPMATSVFFNKIIINTNAKTDKEHIQVIIENNTKIPDRTNHIINHGENPLKHLIKSAIKLEVMGADLIAMPCNTAHYYYDDVDGFLDTEFVNMIDLTLSHLKWKLITKVAVLATEGTISSKVYDKYNKYDLELVYPSAKDQKQLMSLIYRVKAGETKIPKREYVNIIKNLKNQGIKNIVLGCTELPILFSTYNGDDVNLHDPMEIMAKELVKKAMS